MKGLSLSLALEQSELELTGGQVLGRLSGAILDFVLNSVKLQKNGTSFASMCHKETTIQTDDGKC